MTVETRIVAALAEIGRSMTLSRLVGTGPSTTDVTVLGVLQAYAAQDIRDGLQQGDAKVTISNSEIAVAAWPGPPAYGDLLVVDGRTWVVQGCETKYIGADPVAHVLQVRGG